MIAPSYSCAHEDFRDDTIIPPAVREDSANILVSLRTPQREAQCGFCLRRVRRGGREWGGAYTGFDLAAAHACE